MNVVLVAPPMRHPTNFLVDEIDEQFSPGCSLLFFSLLTSILFLKSEFPTQTTRNKIMDVTKNHGI